MEKTIFLFTRKATRSRKDFGKHYIGNHAPLGRRLTRGLLGYTVKSGPEQRLAGRIDGALGPRRDGPSDAFECLRSTTGFRGGSRRRHLTLRWISLYVVTAEKEIVSGELLDSPLGELTPECKAVWTFHDASALPQAPRKARRVVDNFVSYELVHTGNGKWEKRAADVAVFRMAWTSGPNGPNDECMIVDEYRQIPCPPPGWSADRDA